MRRTNQRFQCYDLVWIKEKIPWIKSGGKVVAYRDNCGKRAVVLGSYSDLHSGGNRRSFAVAVEGEGFNAWFDENDLVFLEEGRTDLYEQWR